MYFSGYNKIFWGLIFTLVNINIGPIDIFPNVIGYILIYSGLNTLSGQHQVYSKGKLPAVILGIASINDIVKINNNNLITDELSSTSLWFSVLSGMLIVLSIYLMFCICSGIYMVAQSKGFEKLMIEAKSRWKIYFFINAAMAVYLPFAINLPNDLRQAGIVFVIISILAMLSLIGLVRQARGQLGEQEQ